VTGRWSVDDSADDSDDRFNDHSVAHRSSAACRISIRLGKVMCCGEITPHRDVKTLHLGVNLHQCNTDNLLIWIGE